MYASCIIFLHCDESGHLEAEWECMTVISSEVVNLTAEQQASTILWKCAQNFGKTVRVMYAFVFGELQSFINYRSLSVTKCNMYALS